jgi:uncharacterized protein YqiB (DUF1249 family)
MIKDGKQILEIRQRMARNYAKLLRLLADQDKCLRSMCTR